MDMAKSIAIAVAFLLLGSALPAKADSHWPCPEDVSRPGAGCFELWTECNRFFPLISVDQEKATEKIDEEAVENAVRSRIRTANLYELMERGGEARYWINKKGLADDDLYWPWIADFRLVVHVVGRAFSVEARLSKWRLDHFSDEAKPSVAWKSDWLGQGDETSILGVVGKVMDEFIENYLRVNGVACRERWRDEADGEPVTTGPPDSPASRPESRTVRSVAGIQS